jgi:hypothetical protein
MDVKTLIKKVLENLGASQAADAAKVVNAFDEAEVYSFLREKVFKTDVKTKAFLEKCKKEDEVGLPTKQELTEPEFCELIFESLEKHLRSGGSKFKYSSHYFSVEKDLAITIADKNGFLSSYRVLAIKSS